MFIKTLLFALVVSTHLGNHAQAQEVALLSPHKVLKLVPKHIEGFHQIMDPKALQMKVGTVTYTLCEKNFNDGKRTVKILLFDFKEAAVMYNQATSKWNNQATIESDSIIERAVLIRNCTGWESSNKKNKTAQIFLGIHNRFFLTITGENMELNELQETLEWFPLAEFPK